MGFGLKTLTNPGAILGAGIAGPAAGISGGHSYDDDKDSKDSWFGVGGTMGDLLEFQSHEGQNVWHNLQDNPERAFEGNADPLSNKFWNFITGREDRPLINEFGGPTSYDYRTANDRGIDTQDSSKAHTAAQITAGMIAGGYGAGALMGGYTGGAAAAGGGGSSLATATPWLARLGGGLIKSNYLNDYLHEDYMNGYEDPRKKKRPTTLAGMSGLPEETYAPPPRGNPPGSVPGGARFGTNDEDDKPINQGWNLEDVWKRMNNA